MKKSSNILTSTPPTNTDIVVSENSVDVIVSPLKVVAIAQTQDDAKTTKTNEEKENQMIVIIYILHL